MAELEELIVELFLRCGREVMLEENFAARALYSNYMALLDFYKCFQDKNLEEIYFKPWLESARKYLKTRLESRPRIARIFCSIINEFYSRAYKIFERRSVFELKRAFKKSYFELRRAESELKVAFGKSYSEIKDIEAGLNF